MIDQIAAAEAPTTLEAILDALERLANDGGQVRLADEAARPRLRYCTGAQVTAPDQQPCNWYGYGYCLGLECARRLIPLRAFRPICGVTRSRIVLDVSEPPCEELPAMPGLIKHTVGLSFAKAASKLDSRLQKAGGITPAVAEAKAREKINAIIADPEAAVKALAEKLQKGAPQPSEELQIATVAAVDSPTDRVQLAARYGLDIVAVETLAAKLRA